MSEQNGGFVAEVNSKFELAVVERLCRPVLSIVPLSVHPNTLSLLTHVVVWITGAFAVVAHHLEQPWHSLTLVGAGVGTLCSMIGDSLDGMQARRTDRCSRLGEMMDHWLDAFAVPMVTLGLCAALQLPAWLTAAVHITNSMIYNSQLVLYHHSSRFVHTKTSGVDAQVGVSAGYLVFAALFYLIDRGDYWFDLGILLFACTAVLIQVKLNVFYYARLKGLALHTLPFVLTCGGFAALHIAGAIDQLAFLLAVVLVSFRITGGYVLHTILGLRYRGIDLGIAALIVATGALHAAAPSARVAGVSVVGALPYLSCIYMAARSLIDFARHYSALTLPSGSGEGSNA
jgi:phosphatidylglycerophosphate synthase